MTKLKQYPLRGYDTFEEGSPSDPRNASSHTPISYQREDSDKSRSAAVEAQRLGSMGSWADQFSGGTPATNMTPPASTVNGDEETAQNIQYPRLLHDMDPSDPPPVYTPEASTAGTTGAPSSPVATRVAPVFLPVSTPVNDDSPYSPSRSGSQSQAQHQPYESDDNIEDDPSASLLPEPVQYPYQQTPSQTPSPSVSPKTPRSWKKRWCVPRHSHRGHAYRRLDGKSRTRRFKRTCWIICALLLCLLVMLPDLCKSSSDNGHTQLPNLGPKPNDQFPPSRREHRQHETSHSITGTYQLYDLLDLSTSSGSISITVDVQPGDKPAVLRLSAKSGSVNVQMVPASGGGGWFFWKKPKPKPGDDLEEKVNNLGRVFQTEISTRSGSVSGAVVHGNGGSTSISTSSGSISISIHPVGVSGTDPLSTLKTTAGSGSQNIRILSPSSVPGYRTTTSAIRALRASHTTTGSGSISAIYPEEWTGQLHVALRGSGSIQARGSGLQVQQQGRHELFGWKGDDAEHGASIDITEMGSGSVHFQC